VVSNQLQEEENHLHICHEEWTKEEELNYTQEENESVMVGDNMNAVPMLPSIFSDTQSIISIITSIIDMFAISVITVTFLHLYYH
jgi:hypothetical protein